MPNTVNFSLQVVPLHTENPYPIIDAAIAVIQQAGLPYEVTAFSTQIEGSYAEIMELLNKVRAACYQAGANELLLNMQLQESTEREILMEDKTAKFRNWYQSLHQLGAV